MKILYLNTLYPPNIGGGAEKTLQTLVEGMRSRNHEVSVLATGRESNIVEDRINEVSIFRSKLVNLYWHHQKIRPPSWKRLLWHLFDIYNPVMGAVVSKVVRGLRPDVVSIHNLAGFSAAAWRAIRRSGTPMVQVLHDYYNLCPNSNMFYSGKSCSRRCIRCKSFRLIQPKLSESVDAVVGVSRFIIERHLKNNLFLGSKIKKVIYNARNMSLSPRKSMGPKNNQTIFGFMGTLAPAKGIELLLHVFKKLDLPNTGLDVAGVGKTQYEELLKTRFESSKIRFLGYSSPERFFSRIDILVVPSIWNDTFPGVVFESLAFGVPVIGSDKGGIPEMIKHGENGFLFNPDRPEELAAIICSMTNNSCSIESLASNALTSSKPFIDMARWLDQWESIYKQLETLNSGDYSSINYN
jgi:glycosyltransferase involved in cell wall biosynthesis